MTVVAAPPHSFDTHHEDIIHDVQVDYYGKRLATASSDRTVRIFEVEPNKPERLLATLNGHESPVWQVAWAHPKFGSLLASCSYDGTVIVWKESAGNPPSGNPAHQQPMPSFTAKQPTTASWTRVKEYRGHEASVNSIAWAPAEFGLVLACASSDGRVSVLTYQPPPPPQDHQQQQQQQQEQQPLWKVQVIEAHQIGCNAVSWSPSAIPESLFAVSSSNGETDQEKELVFSPPRLATAGCDNLVKIWRLDQEDKWVLDGTPLEGHSDWVRDVAWAPNIGVPVQVIASCSQDKTVRIWKEHEQQPGEWTCSLLTPKDPSFFGDVVWRVNWSGSGNLLAVSCGDNHVTLWRETLEGEWECVSNIDQGTLK